MRAKTKRHKLLYYPKKDPPNQDFNYNTKIEVNREVMKPGTLWLPDRLARVNFPLLTGNINKAASTATYGLPASMGWGKIWTYGKRLSMDHQRILIAALSLVTEQKSFEIQYSPYAIIKKMGNVTGGDNFRVVKEGLEALNDSGIKVYKTYNKDLIPIMEGPLLKLLGGNKLIFHPFFKTEFSRWQITRLFNDELWRELRRKGLDEKLLWFFMSHKTFYKDGRFKILIEKLCRTLIVDESQKLEKYYWRRKLRKALIRLKQRDFITYQRVGKRVVSVKVTIKNDEDSD